MNNYLNYYRIPKYSDPPSPINYIEGTNLPSTGNADKDRELKHSYELAKNNGLTVDGTPEKLALEWIAADGALKGLGLLGRGAWGIASRVAPRATGAVETAVKSTGKYVGNMVKTGKDKIVTTVNKVLRRNPNGKIVESSNITNNFLKFVDLNPEIKGTKLTTEVIDHLPNDEKLLLKELQNSGVDISKLTREHLTNALDKRAKVLYETVPDTRHAMIFPKQTSGRQTMVYDKPHQIPVGIMRTSVNETGLEVPSLYESFAPGTKVGRDLYDASLRGIQSEQGIGIRSGDNLLESQATTHTWNHYPDKELIGNTGVHRSTKIVDGNKVTDKVLFKLPVYKLTNPSSTNLPTKSVLFDSKIIDNNGVMHVNWDDPNVLHTIIPLWTGYKIYELIDSQPTK